ncbi:hypothetical protein KAI87_10660 [Myxococcota bacterium]|nr:hypothetical protein [Myxococcota bacterium]
MAGTLQAKKRHPIVVAAVQRLRKLEDDTYNYTPEDVEALTLQLLALKAVDPILDAALSLGDWAYFLEKEQNSPKAAKAIFAVINAVGPELEKMSDEGKEAADKLRESAAKLRKITGPTSPQGPSLGGPIPPTGFGVKTRKR